MKGGGGRETVQYMDKIAQNTGEKKREPEAERGEHIQYVNNK